MEVHLAGAAKHQDRARGRPDDPLRDTASQEVGHAGPAVRPHDHEVRAVVGGCLCDALSDFSGSNLNGDVQRLGGQPARDAIEAQPCGLITLARENQALLLHGRSRAVSGRPEAARGQGTARR